MKKKEIVYSYILRATHNSKNNKIDYTTNELALTLGMQRTNISSILNQLVYEKKLEKIDGRPVVYRLIQTTSNNITESSIFKELKGYDNSLNDAVKLAKGAVLYPQKPLHIMLLGQKGVGTSYFAKIIYKFAYENKIIKKEAPFIKLNCSYYVHNENDFLQLMNKQAENNIITMSKGGVLFIDHIHLLPRHMRYILFDLLTICNDNDNKIMLILSSDIDVDESFNKYFFEKIPVKIKIPSLKERTLFERFELIQSRLQNEATHMKKNIIVSAEILQALVLYTCDGNIKQLEKDIKMGCANAYVREFNSDDIFLNFEDFPSYVQKGLIFYKENVIELEKIISKEYIYIFSNNDITKIKDIKPYEKKETIYDNLEERIIKLNKKGIDYDNSNIIISSDFSSEFENYTKQLENKNIDRDSLSKVVDSKIIVLTEDFLKEASLKLNRIFSLSILYGLCLHIAAAIERPHNRHLVNDQLENEAKQHQQEYVLSINFVERLQKELNIPFSLDEAYFITMFIYQTANQQTKNHPVFLIVMHGESTASSIANVVSELTKTDKTYAYDLSLHKEMDIVYQELKQLIISINQEAGILMMFDMGSIKLMGESIERETGINIRFIEIPITLVALDCARKVTVHTDLESVYQSVEESYERYFPLLVENYERLSMHKIILTLCMTGIGGAMRIKHYLQKYLDFENVDIVAMSMLNRNELLTNIDQLKKNNQILYTIGTENPHLYDIPFIPVSEIFSIPSEKLPMYFSINGVNVKQKTNIDYQMIFKNLTEQLPHIKLSSLRKTFPLFIENIDKKYKLSKDQKIGIIMHMASALDRMITNQEIKPIHQYKTIIAKNKKIYNDLKDCLKPIEETFEISYLEEEIASLIQIIKKSQ